ncbi:MAG: DMT family transporter [Pseudorhodoplanes sp.]
MSAWLLGAAAAFGWGLFDFLIRFSSRRTSGLQAVLIVLVAGATILLAAALALGEPVSPPINGFWQTAIAGTAYACALTCGYRAFTIGPVSFVAPIVSAYPVLTTLWAVANGFRPGMGEWLGVVSVLIGVALVARFAAEQPRQNERTGWRPRIHALVYACSACVLSSIAFIVGQLATQNDSELSVTLYGRLWAIAAILPIAFANGISLHGARSWLPLLIVMGGLDAMSLLAVNAAGSMEGAEYAVVIASTFGAVTVAMAVLILKERLSMLQCLGMACIFAGVIALSNHF